MFLVFTFVYLDVDCTSVNIVTARWMIKIYGGQIYASRAHGFVR